MKNPCRLAIPVCLLALVSTEAARADIVPTFDFVSTFDFSVTFNGLPSMQLTSGGSTVSLQGVHANDVPNFPSLGLTLIFFDASSTTPPTALDAFTRVPYTYTLSITDLASGKTWSKDFNRFLTGTMNSVSATFPAADNPLPLGFDFFHFGSTNYLVSTDAFAGPFPPSSGPGPRGSLNASVKIYIGDLGTGIAATSSPEPSSVLLCGMGGLCCLAAWRRKWATWRCGQSS